MMSPPCVSPFDRHRRARFVSSNCPLGGNLLRLPLSQRAKFARSRSVRLALTLTHPRFPNPSSRSLERLDLTFRAEPARRPRAGIALGWWLWCLIGLAAGFGVWWGSRYYLTLRLSDQLATAQSPSDAFLALEGLLMLDSNATLEIARGLQHPNTQVARTAYRTLDAQISGWSQLQSSIAAARMRMLAQRLCELPETTPADNLVLASSLASRIFSLCLELDDPQLAPVMSACESVFQRVGRSGVVSPAAGKSPVQVASNVVSSAELDELGLQINALRPLPSLAQTPVEPIVSSDSSRPVETDQRATSDSTGLVPGIAPLPGVAAREILHSSSSTPSDKVQFLTTASRPQRLSDGQLQASDADGQLSASASLSDTSDAEFSLDDAAGSLSDSAAETARSPRPSVVHGPASVRSQPLAEMPRMQADVDIDSIPQLDINALVRLLPSQQPRVAQAAALALRSKGFPDDRLALASQLATSPPLERIRILQSIATDPSVEPRPWLLWMAEIGEVEVKQQAIGLLSSMAQDLNMQQDLRRLLAQESDESVAQAIRQVLFARR